MDTVKLALPIGAKVVSRALDVDHDDVRAVACVNSVIYDDGSKETFN
jgi:hypothetical protein